MRVTSASLICDREVRLGAKSVDDIKRHPFFKGLAWDRLRERACLLLGLRGRYHVPY
jgi:hypothetical protein